MLAARLYEDAIVAQSDSSDGSQEGVETACYGPDCFRCLLRPGKIYTNQTPSMLFLGPSWQHIQDPHIWMANGCFFWMDGKNMDGKNMDVVWVHVHIWGP